MGIFRRFTQTDGEFPMKTMILAIFAALSLGLSVANAASTIAGDAEATRQQQTGSNGQ
jgi:hypothetical protein